MNLLKTLISAYFINTQFSVKVHTSMSFFYIWMLKRKKFVSILNLNQNSNIKSYQNNNPIESAAF